MMGQFDDPLTLTEPPIAKGVFNWDRCYVMAVFVLQSDSANDDGSTKDFAAYYALEQVTPIARAGDDPDGKQGDQIWRVSLKRDPNSSRQLKPGRALATMVALVGTVGTVQMAQWCQAIELRSPG